MNAIVIAIVSVTVIGLICAVILSIFSKLFAVHEDERFPAVRECLPGANCGACGYAGCDGYAHAIIEKGAKTNLCVPGGDGASRNISDVLGVDFQDVVEQTAFVRCGGDCEKTKNKMDYEGLESCKAAKLVFGGTGSCTYGCMGLGDCAAVCPHKAICVEDGLARIDPRACIGCGLCAKTCPQKIITLLPTAYKPRVRCANPEKGAEVRKVCSTGCIACKKCEKECPAGAITVEANLSRIDYETCTGCGRCAEVCPVKCIVIEDIPATQK